MMSSSAAKSAKLANPQRAKGLRARHHTDADPRGIFFCDLDAARCDDDMRMTR